MIALKEIVPESLRELKKICNDIVAYNKMRTADLKLKCQEVHKII